MIGETISHYKIIKKLGSGGMGVVYKAQDLKLNRFVALKLLPHYLTNTEDEKKRFIHEAQTASALEHTNICNIHEINEIKRLKHYPNLKALYLEKNKITRIEKLNNLVNLKKLHLEFNLITEISGLGSLIDLEDLELSGNQISKIQNIDHLQKLKELLLNNNKLELFDSLV